MQKMLKAAVVAAVMVSGSVAQAGGPVLIEEGNNELIEAQPVRSAGLLPVLGILVLACLLACGNNGSDAPPPVPPK